MIVRNKCLIAKLAECTTQNSFPAGVPPGPRWGAYDAPQTSYNGIGTRTGHPLSIPSLDTFCVFVISCRKTVDRYACVSVKNS